MHVMYTRLDHSSIWRQVIIVTRILIASQCGKSIFTGKNYFSKPVFSMVKTGFSTVGKNLPTLPSINQYVRRFELLLTMLQGELANQLATMSQLEPCGVLWVLNLILWQFLAECIKWEWSTHWHKFSLIGKLWHVSSILHSWVLIWSLYKQSIISNTDRTKDLGSKLECITRPYCNFPEWPECSQFPSPIPENEFSPDPRYLFVKWKQINCANLTFRDTLPNIVLKKSA